MNKYASVTPSFIASSILSIVLCTFSSLASASVFEEDFENTELGGSLASGWQILRTTENQQVIVENVDQPTSPENPSSKALRVRDQDATPGLFGPALRYRLDTSPASISFDLMLLDQREFPSVSFANSTGNIFQLIFADQSRSGQLAYQTRTGMESLEYTIPLNTWHRVSLHFSDQITLTIHPEAGAEATFEISASAESISTASYLEFLLAGSSKGTNGDMLLDNIKIETKQIEE